MKKQIKEIPSILFLMISFGVAIRVMTEGKEEVPLHWNARGEIDDHSSSCHRFGVVWITYPFATSTPMV